MGIETTWARTRVHATYEDADGTRINGSVVVRSDSRLTSTENPDLVIPAGVIQSATMSLNTNKRMGASYDAYLPATDDNEITETGWKIILTVKFCGHRPDETYVFGDDPTNNGHLAKLPSGGTVNLADIVPVNPRWWRDHGVSEVVANGKPGVGIVAITDAGDGTAVVLLSDATKHTITLPKGRSVVSIENVSGGDKAVVTYSDGTTSELNLPRNALIGISEIGKDIVTATDAEDVRRTLELGTAATSDASDFATHLDVAGAVEVLNQADIDTRQAASTYTDNSVAAIQARLEAEAATRRQEDEGNLDAAQSYADVSLHEHTNATDPHPQYVTVDEAGALAPVQSVAGRTGDVTLRSVDMPDFTEAVQDAVASMLVSGASISIDYDDEADRMVISASVPETPGAAGTAESIRDTVGAALIGINGVSVGINDAADTITLSVTNISQSQVAGLTEALAAKADVTHTHRVEELTGYSSLVTKTELGDRISTKVDTTDPRLSDARTPKAHTHTIANVTSLQSALDGKVGTSDARLADARTPLPHTHALSDVTGTGNLATNTSVSDAVSSAMTAHKSETDPHTQYAKAADLSGHIAAEDPHPQYTTAGELVDAIATRAAVVHKHDVSDINGADDFATKDDITVGVTTAVREHTSAADPHPQYLTTEEGLTLTSGMVASNDPRLSDARTPLSHKHGISDVTNLQSALDTKVGTSDARLSDARSPLPHTHALSDVTGAENLATKVNVADAVTAHTNADDPHPQYAMDSDIANKVDTSDPRLSDARNPLAHTHAISEVTNLQSELDGKVGTGDARLSDARTPKAHTHEIGDTTGLQSSLDGKVGMSDSRLSDARTPVAHTHALSDVTGAENLATKTELTNAIRPPEYTQPTSDLEVDKTNAIVRWKAEGNGGEILRLDFDTSAYSLLSAEVDRRTLSTKITANVRCKTTSSDKSSGSWLILESYAPKARVFRASVFVIPFVVVTEHNSTDTIQYANGALLPEGDKYPSAVAFGSIPAMSSTFNVLCAGANLTKMTSGRMYKMVFTVMHT